MRHWIPALLALLALAFTPACTEKSDTSDPKITGESHWLLPCTTDAECGDTFGTCQCGLCNITCTTDSTCADTAGDGAVCSTDASTCSSVCLPECTTDADCTDGTDLTCTAGTCGPPPDNVDPGVACGDTTCAAGMVCCNASCGICTPPGEACITLACEDENSGDNSSTDPGEVCGDVICGEGTTCCNASCGICVEPGFACTQQACEPGDNSSTDPGEVCGDVICEEGMVCCNASCGICTAPGDACTQQVCE